MTRYVFVTGGVVSSLGKGIAAASLAAILEARGLKVTMIKLARTQNQARFRLTASPSSARFVTRRGRRVTRGRGSVPEAVRLARAGGEVRAKVNPANRWGRTGFMVVRPTGLEPVTYGFVVLN